MSIHRKIGRTGVRMVKRALGVQAALEWAFRVEQAQLELPPPKDAIEEGFGFGLEYVLLQRAALGCKVDGGQHKMGSYTHPYAEVIAATVAAMPNSLGGFRMAIQVAELARAGMTRGKWRTVEVLACPVTWRPHPEQIAYARRSYDQWWQALDWIRDGLISGGMMREIDVTDTMPKVRPWANK